MHGCGNPSKIITHYLNTNFDIVKYVSEYVPELVALKAYVEAGIDNVYFLGSFVAEPSTSNSGGPLVTGSLYYNTTKSELFVYNGTEWFSLQTPSDAVFDSVQFSGGDPDQGILSWNSDEETLDLTENGTILQIGQETHYHVRNNSGITIPNGAAVMATGTLGASGRITAAVMDGSDINNAKFFLGLATETIADGLDGKVTHFGKVHHVDTSSYNEGDVLWISNVAPGGLINYKPTSGVKLPIAIAINSKNNGTLFVRATQGTTIGEANDVHTNALSDGDVLTWNAANNRWENINLSGVISGTTNLGVIQSGNDITITSSTGTSGSLLPATVTYAGSLSIEDKAKLDSTPSTLTYTLSDGSSLTNATIQEAFEEEQEKVIYGGTY